MHREISREELADYLEDLARGLRRGTVEIEGRAWTIPEKVAAELGVKEKKGRLSAKLKWNWSTLADYDREAREEVTRWETSLKEVKKELTFAYRELSRTLNEGRLPDQRVLAAFITSSQALARFAEPEWKEAMEEYLDHLENLIRAVEEGHTDIAAHELRDLGNRMQACHREFK